MFSLRTIVLGVIVCSATLEASVCGLLIASFDRDKVDLAIVHLAQTTKRNAVVLEAPRGRYPFRSTLSLYQLPGDPVRDALVRQSMSFYHAMALPGFSMPPLPQAQITAQQVLSQQENRAANTLEGFRERWDLLEQAGHLEETILEAAEVSFVSNPALGCALGAFVCYSIGLNSHQPTLIKLGGRLLRETVRQGIQAHRNADYKRATAKYLEELRQRFAQSVHPDATTLHIHIIIDNHTPVGSLTDYLILHTDFVQ